MRILFLIAALAGVLAPVRGSGSLDADLLREGMTAAEAAAGAPVDDAALVKRMEANADTVNADLKKMRKLRLEWFEVNFYGLKKVKTMLAAFDEGKQAKMKEIINNFLASRLGALPNNGIGLPSDELGERMDQIKKSAELRLAQLAIAVHMHFKGKDKEYSGAKLWKQYDGKGNRIVAPPTALQNSLVETGEGKSEFVRPDSVHSKGVFLHNSTRLILTDKERDERRQAKVPKKAAFTSGELRQLDRLTTDARQGLMLVIEKVEKYTTKKLSTSYMKTHRGLSKELQMKEGVVIREASARFKKTIYDALRAMKSTKSYLRDQTTARKDSFVAALLKETEKKLMKGIMTEVQKAASIGLDVQGKKIVTLSEGTSISGRHVADMAKEAGARLLQVDAGYAAPHVRPEADGSVDAHVDSALAKLPGDVRRELVQSVVKAAKTSLESYFKRDVAEAVAAIQKAQAGAAPVAPFDGSKVMDEALAKIRAHAHEKTEAIVANLAALTKEKVPKLAAAKKKALLGKIMEQVVVRFRDEVRNATTAFDVAKVSLAGQSPEVIARFTSPYMLKALSSIDKDFDESIKFGTHILDEAKGMMSAGKDVDVLVQLPERDADDAGEDDILVQLVSDQLAARMDALHNALVAGDTAQLRALHLE